MILNETLWSPYCEHRVIIIVIFLLTFTNHSLRHVEYYRGILFLTTNRVKAFDEAFLSRIHVALHFRELSEASKAQVWTAFINRIGASKSVTEAEIKDLAKRNVNGRQIKNSVRTAHSLALARGEELQYEHLLQTLDAIDEFTKEFRR